MKTLAEAQAANLPRLTLADLPIELFGDPESVKANEAALNQYLSQFARMEDNLTCPICEKVTSIVWGLQHGVALCVRCGYPWRVYHYDLPGCKRRVDIALPYHPDELETG